MVLTDKYISFEDDTVETHEISNINMIAYYLHLYLRKAMLNGTNAYRYDVYVFDDINGTSCTKIGHFEENYITTDKRVVVVCSNKEFASILREELVVNYRYIVINEEMERILGLTS